jgi:phage protein D
MSFRGKGKEPHERHWEGQTLGRILEDAAGDAGMSIRVHADLASRQIAYEAQDRESFFTFANRLAAQHGATFSIMGQRSGFVPRNRGLSVKGEPLRTITAKWDDNLIAARGIIPLTDRYRFSASKASWYDIDKARLVQEKVEADSNVDVEDHVRFDQSGPDEAVWAAETDALNAAREKGAGMLTINGEPGAEIEATVMLAGCRAGIDGAYTITGVTHALDREGGFQTDLTLAHPHASAGADGR